MSEEAYYGLIDPKKTTEETIEHFLYTRYSVKCVSNFSHELGEGRLKFGIYSESLGSMPTGLLEEVQASGWKIIQSGTRFNKESKENLCYIEILEKEEQ